MKTNLLRPLSEEDMIAPSSLHPIMMSTQMQKANLKRWKWVTRRSAGLKKINEEAEGWMLLTVKKSGKHTIAEFSNGGEVKYIKCPYGDIGHFLWVRETFIKNENPASPNFGKYEYKADYSDTHAVDLITWKPAIHMPRAASRMLLKVTGIAIERLFEISEKECVYEGLHRYSNGFFHNYSVPIADETKEGFDEFCIMWMYADGRKSYQSLWDSINGKGAWEEDLKKFVWVIHYEIIKP